MKQLILILLFWLSTPLIAQDFQPYLIAPFQTGKSIGMEPWLGPKDAFNTLINARVNKGVLEKRQGYQLFATMKHGSTVQTKTAIMGIKTYFRNNMPTLLIFDTLRVNKYDALNETMTDIAGSDIFTGGDDNYFQLCNWIGTAYFTNNVDQIYKYTGSGNVSVFNVQVSSTGATNQIQTCRYIFIKNDRMLLLDVVENGLWIPQRCRYSPVLSSSFYASGSGYIDAPTQDVITSAGWVGKDIVVFFQGRYTGSIWRIRTTGNVDLPLKWEKITDTSGSVSPYSSVEFNEGMAVIGLKNILFFDGFTAIPIDIAKVRDIVNDFDVTKLKYSTAHYVTEDQHVYFTYTTSGEDYPDRILDYNVMEQIWAVHKYDVHCLGTFNDQQVPIWTDLDKAYTGTNGDTADNMTFDSRYVFGDPYPFTLMGTRVSTVYKMNTGNYDGVDAVAGTIDIDIRSARWNPYIQDNKKVSMNKISFLVDNDSTASFTVSFYIDSRSAAAITRTISCDGDVDTEDKFWVSASVSLAGDFISIKISHDERNNRPRIHAIMPFFAPGGELGL